MQRYSVPVRIVLWQTLVALIGAVIWMTAAGTDAALAALAGGGASALLSLQFAIRVFSRGAAPPEQVLGGFYRAEAFKLILAMALFVVAAKYFGHLFVPLLTTYLATLVVFWAALLWKLD